MYKPEVVTLSIGIARFPNSLCLYLQNPSALQRDLHFLIFRCQNSSACLVFYSGIYIFLFSAVKIPLLAWFSTAGFAFFSFPLFAEFYQKGRPQQPAIFQCFSLSCLKIDLPFYRLVIKSTEPMFLYAHFSNF